MEDPFCKSSHIELSAVQFQLHICQQIPQLWNGFTTYVPAPQHSFVFSVLNLYVDKESYLQECINWQLQPGLCTGSLLISSIYYAYKLVFLKKDCSPMQLPIQIEETAYYVADQQSVILYFCYIKIYAYACFENHCSNFQASGNRAIL